MPGSHFDGLVDEPESLQSKRRWAALQPNSNLPHQPVELLVALNAEVRPNQELGWRHATPRGRRAL